MGRKRRRREAEENDDAVERAYLAREMDRSSAERSKSVESKKGDHGNNDTTNNDEDSNTDQRIARMREKKRLKKLRQKEKKVAAQKAQDDALSLKSQKQQEQTRQENARKKQKLSDGKAPASNKFTKTRMGVEYCDIVVGKGPIVQDRKKVRCKYVLRANNKQGKILDRSGNFGFRVGKGEVIQGWEIGLKQMRQGGTRHIIVPPGAGYGNKDIGGGPGALLYFEVTLLQC